MKKTTFIIPLFLFFLFLSSCNSNVDNSNVDNNTNTGNSTENTNDNTNKNAFLEIVNKYPDFSISTIRLVGYSFEYLDILYNESKTFELTNGIPGGYDNVNVIISYNFIRAVATNDYAKKVRCNFEKGKITTITLNSDGSLVVTY